MSDLMQKGHVKDTWYVMYQSYIFPAEGYVTFGPVDVYNNSPCVGSYYVYIIMYCVNPSNMFY